MDVDERFAAEVGELGVPRILSTHREARTVEEVDALARRLDDLRVPGRDLVKLVPPAGEASFGLEVLVWLAARPAGGTVAFCSGEPGSFTRLLAPAYGSALTYAAPEPVAGVRWRRPPRELLASHVRAVGRGERRHGPRRSPRSAVTPSRTRGPRRPRRRAASLRADGLSSPSAPKAPLSPAVSAAPAGAPLLAGLSVTAPYKDHPLALVGSGTSSRSRRRRPWGPPTRWRGPAPGASNTDAPAVRAALKAGARLRGCEALVVQGGAARAAVHALLGAGARVTVAARRRPAAEALGWTRPRPGRPRAPGARAERGRAHHAARDRRRGRAPVPTNTCGRAPSSSTRSSPRRTSLLRRGRPEAPCPSRALMVLAPGLAAAPADLRGALPGGLRVGGPAR